MFIIVASYFQVAPASLLLFDCECNNHHMESADREPWEKDGGGVPRERKPDCLIFKS